MNCQEAQERLENYWNLDEQDPDRIELEAHLLDCESCAEELQLWEESESLIRNYSERAFEQAPLDHVSKGVMDRIYAEQSWLMPVSNRSYHFTPFFRRNVAAAIACCLAMFVCGFFYLIHGTASDSASAQIAKVTGLIETANATSDVSVISADFYQDVPVASISDPLMLKVVPTIPQYWIALSLLGMIMTLLILNWLSRTKT
jgi:hypothetical protein